MALLLPEYVSCSRKVIGEITATHVRWSRGYGPAGHVWPEGARGGGGMGSFLPVLQFTVQWQQPFAYFSMKRLGQKTHFLRMYILTLSHSSDDVTGSSSPSWGFAAYEPVWYFWILTEGSVVTQTQPIFSQMLALQAVENILTHVCGELSMKIVSVWAKAPGQCHNKELDGNHSALRHFPHHYKQWVCFVKINCYKTRNMRVAHWDGRAIVQRWGGRSSHCPLLQWDRVLCIQCATVIIYISFV